MISKLISRKFGEIKAFYAVKIINIFNIVNIINVINIFTNIAQYHNRGNLTMKFGQLIKYNMKNIFIEKSYTKFAKCGGETIPWPFSKNSADLWINNPKFYTVCFYCM